MNKITYKENLDDAIKEIEKLPLYKLDDNTKLLKQAFDILYEKGIFTLYKVDMKELSTLD